MQNRQWFIYDFLISQFSGVEALTSAEKEFKKIPKSWFGSSHCLFSYRMVGQIF